MKNQPTVDFPGKNRIHIALAVSDLERSKVFYEKLLGVAPIKERLGYAKFEPKDPSVNLALNEISDLGQNASSAAAHFGIQVKSRQAVEDSILRLSQAGLKTSIEENTTCCYAVQDKVWVTDPDGNQWEIFVVLDADAKRKIDQTSVCCEMDSTQQTNASGSCC